MSEKYIPYSDDYYDYYILYGKNMMTTKIYFTKRYIDLMVSVQESHNINLIRINCYAKISNPQPLTTNVKNMRKILELTKYKNNKNFFIGSILKRFKKLDEEKIKFDPYINYKVMMKKIWNDELFISEFGQEIFSYENTKDEINKLNDEINIIESVIYLLKQNGYKWNKSCLPLLMLRSVIYENSLLLLRKKIQKREELKQKII